MQKNSLKILGVRFDKVTMDQALTKAHEVVTGKRQRYFTTPNPEIILKTLKNKKYKKIINNSDLNIADGTGIIWAANYLHKSYKKSPNTKIHQWFGTLLTTPFQKFKKNLPLPERVTGTDLMQRICTSKKFNQHKIFLLGAAPGIAKTVKAKLELQNAKVQIVDTFAGTPKKPQENKIIKKINASESNILFVAFGAPKQEIWITRNLQKLKTVKLAIGVGGAFDFIAGSKKRAPKWMRKIGLEWLYRVMIQPSRIVRIYNATIKFPIKVLKHNLKKTTPFY